MVVRLKEIYNWLDKEINRYTEAYTSTGNKLYYEVVKELRNVKECMNDLRDNREEFLKMALAKSFLYGQSEIEENDNKKIYKRLYSIFKAWHNQNRDKLISRTYKASL